MIKVLMVCLGNICRSPLAEGILKDKVSSENVLVDSSGTASYHIGSPPDSRSIAVAKKYGLDISNLKGRQFSVRDFDEFDFIYVMDNYNYIEVTNQARNQEDISKVKLILNEIYPNQDFNVPDPYQSGQQAFEDVFMMLDEACTIIADKIK